MSYEDAINYMEKYQCLPLCKHGNHLIDWGRELLAPPCGCSLTLRVPDVAKAHAPWCASRNNDICDCAGWHPRHAGNA